jgi:hypothetical protein
VAAKIAAVAPKSFVRYMKYGFNGKAINPFSSTARVTVVINDIAIETTMVMVGG